MAAAGEGTSYERGGGAGGKFRKRASRISHTTPYDRPPTALRNPKNGWLSKLVDPASKIISASAHMFFSTVFRKRLPPAPQPSPGANQESGDTLLVQEVAIQNNSPGDKQSALNNGSHINNSPGSSGISELEKMLKQKTFTRSEIDHLTELLRLRTSDLPVNDENKRTDTDLPKPMSAVGRREDFESSPMQVNGIESHRLQGVVSTPVVSSKVLEEDVASPAELAKAYMGSRPSKVSPSMLGLRGHALREDAPFLNNVTFPPKSPFMSLAPKSAIRIGVPENGFITPRSRGRSALYSMARTPYSRVFSAANKKGVGSAFDAYGVSSSSQYAWEQDGNLSSKRVALKRRSSVLDDDIGSVGPIRRTRQKPNLLYPRNLSLPVSGGPLSSRARVGSDAVQHPTSSTQKLLLSDEPKSDASKMLGEIENNNIRTTSFAFVPSKSTEMATKILQHLEKLTPKEKSSESKLSAARDNTPNMPSGKALRSLEDMEASKLLWDARDSCKSKDTQNTSLPDARDSTTQNQAKIEENGPKTLVVPLDISASAVNSVDTAVLFKDVSNLKNADSATANFIAQPPQKKQAFQMSAHEDSSELNDDLHSNGNVFTLPAEVREKAEMPMVEKRAIATEASAVDNNAALREIKTSAGFELNKGIGLETNDASVTGEKGVGFTLPNRPVPSTTLQAAAVSPQSSTSSFNAIVPPKDANAPPTLFSVGSKNGDTASPFKFSSTSSINESSGLKSSALLDPKPESSKSFVNVAFGATNSFLKTSESDKVDSTITQNAGDLMGKSGTVFPSALSTSTSTSSIFSFGSSANNSSLHNGSLSSKPSIFSSSAPVQSSSNLANQNSFGDSIHITSTTSTVSTATTAAPNSSLLPSAAALPFSGAPIFRFGSSVAPSTSVSAASTSGVQDTNSKMNTQKDTTLGNQTSLSFGGTSFAMPIAGSSVFGFGASATSSGNDQCQGTLFSSSGGSLEGAQASTAGTGVPTATEAMPVQFGSSPVFGSSALTSSSSLFGSSAHGAMPFSSGSSFGPTAAASSLESNVINSTSGATSLFGSSLQPAKSPVFGSSSSNSIFNSSSPSTRFSFGASSASIASSDSAPSMVFGSSTGAPSASIFSFTTSVASTSSVSQTQPVFGNSNLSFPPSSGNGDQMSMEDSMAEDPVQASPTVVPVFGQPPILPQSGFVFGSSAPAAASPFQFGSQQNQATPQNPSPFQASGSLEFNAGGGSFSLGSGGGDKSSRKIVRVQRKNRKK